MKGRRLLANQLWVIIIMYTHTTLTNGIPTVDNVSYGRSINQSTTQPISTEKNLAYRNVANLNDPVNQADVYDYVDVHNFKA